VCIPEVSAAKVCAWQLQAQTRSAVFKDVLQKLASPERKASQGLGLRMIMSAGAALPLIGDGADHGTEYLAR
jgi:hypothetical protein